MHAIESGAVAAGEERSDVLVGEDHQLLDEHVRVWLGLQNSFGDTTVAEAKLELRRLHGERAAREAPLAQTGGEHRVQVELLEDGRVGLTTLCLPVAEPGVRADHRAVEERLGAAGRQLDGDAQPILVRPQRAGVVGELVRQHRRDEPGDVGREGAARGPVVERRPGGDEERDVGDVHPRADPLGLATERERVVEVLRGVGVDRVREQVAQVGPVRVLGLRRVVRFEGLPHAAVDEQRLEHVLDPVGRPEELFDLRASPAGAHDRELPG